MSTTGNPADGTPADLQRMTRGERRAAISLAAIYALRMLGLFMVLPVLALHASEYAGSTPALVGLAIGIYGLSQATFQIPFGMLSDRFGRKRVIYAGLAVFALGSVVAALADSIGAVILGRALQGLGAIAAAVLALAADLTREEQRTKAMAIIGASIGFTFAVAMVLGPAVTHVAGMPAVFWLTAALAVAGMAALRWLVPNPVASRFHRDTETVPAQFRRVLGDSQLLRLDLGIGLLHLMMTASFVVLPLTLRDHAGLAGAEHWKVYLFALAAAVVLMTPFVILADRRGRAKEVFLGAIVALSLSQVGLWLSGGALAPVVALMVLFFTAFTLLEASLPSLVSRFAPADLKGTALGAYSTAQYLGAFLGGVLGGWMHGLYGAFSVFAACAALSAAWLLIAVGMRAPKPLTTQLLRVGAVDAQRARTLAEELMAIPGVDHAVVVVEDGVAYLKVDRHRLDRDALFAYATRGD